MIAGGIVKSPARPAWQGRYTLAEFFSTALLLGPLFVLMLDAQSLSAAAKTLAGFVGGHRSGDPACHPGSASSSGSRARINLSSALPLCCCQDA